MFLEDRKYRIVSLDLFDEAQINFRLSGVAYRLIIVRCARRREQGPSTKDHRLLALAPLHPSNFHSKLQQS